ncbi:MAG: pyruvate kinase [Verrucomicrobia bacterium]|nr:pyruvate kinase [Verrucomicrobiota bacterium]MCH8511851.1 pyruvate kinase [Kiritimatiellia bacterium]
MSRPYTRRTKIIATLGPATESPEMIRAMILAGVNIFRINMSHAQHEQVRNAVRDIRKISSELITRTSIMMDSRGPEIRTGEVSQNLNLVAGQRIGVTVRGEKSEEEVSVDVNYDQLVEDIRVGDVVLIDNGTIELKVLQKKHNQLVCDVLTPGTLGSRRHVNLPGVRVNLPSLTQQDKEDIKLGVELGVDWFAMSFVREPEDVLRLKSILDYHNAPQKVIAKLEDQEGVRNLDQIIDIADGVMVARGDLGIECPYEELPIIQRRIVKRCALMGKPVIVATHMLESMIENPSPTRAEITDTANAVYEQADAIMLSGETSVGRYPLKCVEIMNRIAARIEQSGGAGYYDCAVMASKYAKLVKSAAVLASECNADALIVFTNTGVIARNAAWLRQVSTPIFAFSSDETLLNQLPLYWGIQPSYLETGHDPEQNVSRAVAKLKERNQLSPGDTVVAVTEVMINGHFVDTILMETVEG